MNDTFTARHEHLGAAPKRIDLIGDKSKRPEPAQHIISFPGGAIEVTRTTTGDYWAHIVINRGWADADQKGLQGARGVVAGSRLDRADELGIDEIPNAGELRQIAVLITKETSS
jgi:hypothetical protein